MDFIAGAFTRGSRRRVLSLIFAGLIAAVTMAIAAPAQAEAPNALAWGYNSNGELGDGTTTTRDVPVAVKELSGVVAVAGGANHGLALLENGAVMAWGANDVGELGNGTKPTQSEVPVPVCASGTVGTCPSGPFLEGVTAISARGNSSMALLTNGTVMEWGEDSVGNLGNGTTGENSDVPVAVCAKGTVGTCPSGPFLEGVTAISAADNFGLALLKDGTVAAWGFNGEGQLGNGTTTNSNVPVAVSGLSEVRAISGSRNDSLALLKNGKVKAWGNNSKGQLGNGTLTSSDVPVAVPAGYFAPGGGAIAIAAGDNHSLALQKDGTVLAWGYNGSGQLGVGPKPGPEPCGNAPFIFSCSKTPVAVEGLSGVTAIAAGEEDSMALLSDGTVKAWGANSLGQLGVGTKAGPDGCTASQNCSNTPVAVCAEGLEVPCPSGPFLSNIEGVAAGSVSNFAFGAKPAVTKRLRHEARPKLGVTPKRGPSSGGTTVTISGSEFLGATAVKFGSTPATSFTVNSDSSITAVSPAGRRKATVHVTVTSPWGTSAISAADHFKFTR